MSTAFAIDAEFVSKVFDLLAAQLQVLREPGSSRELTYHDTFDWRLLRQKSTLASWREQRRTTLVWRTTGGRVRHRLLGLERAPAFTRDLPAGPFREALGPIVAMRRLLPLVRVRLRTLDAKVIDKNGKTVVRLAIERGSASPGDGAPGKRGRLPGAIVVRPVRGYEKHAERVCALLERELHLPFADPSTLLRSLTAIGRSPLDVPDKLELQLHAEMTAAEALRHVLQRLFRTIRHNERGTREDLDSEFLHDFRVSVRRTRSALSQVKGVFATVPLGRFREEFQWLGAITGPTRDMDVYLLKMPGYRSGLPERTRADLDPLESYLTQQQRSEHARLVAALESNRYEQLMLDWESFLDAPDTREAPNADRPATEVAAERIWKAHRKVLKQGRGISPGSAASELHRLRIECKKLRYLLEFFADLFDSDTVRALVKRLKKLQDNLGDLNDLEVQQESLGRFAEELASRGLSSERTQAAIQQLIEHLRNEQDRERTQFSKLFKRFAAPRQVDAYRELFAAPRGLA